MSRQQRTLIVGAALCVLLVVLGMFVRVPYLVLSPGPTYNTLGKSDGNDIIEVLGHPTSATTGNLNLTTVESRTDKATIAEALYGWLKHDKVVVPYDSIVPPGTTQKEQSQQDSAAFAQSQDSATAAAACELGYPKGVLVVNVAKDSPNVDTLKSGDQLVSASGAAVSSDTDLQNVLKTHQVGDQLPAVIQRAGVQSNVTLLLGTPNSGSVIPRLGISLSIECLAPFQVTLRLTGIGGPSAGLMFALGIVDKVGTDDLTHGKFIAGTGTIDASGSVGKIGGIALKMIAAKHAGAVAFLAPESNCADVRGNIPAGLNVIKVSTLHDAITQLDALNAGKPVSHC